MAQAFDAGCAAAHKLGVRRAFEAAFGEGAGVARLFNGLVKGAPLIEDGDGHGNAPVRPRCLATQQVQHAVAKGFVFDGVFHAFALATGGLHGGHSVEHWLNLAFDVAVAVVIRGLPQGLFAAAVGDVVGDEGGDHLGVAHALGLFDGQLFDAVVTHEIQNALLEGPAYPTALLVAGFARQDEVRSRPFAEGLRYFCAQAGKAQLCGGLHGGHRF